MGTPFRKHISRLAPMRSLRAEYVAELCKHTHDKHIERTLFIYCNWKRTARRIEINWKKKNIFKQYHQDQTKRDTFTNEFTHSTHTGHNIHYIYIDGNGLFFL